MYSLGRSEFDVLEKAGSCPFSELHRESVQYHGGVEEDKMR